MTPVCLLIAILLPFLAGALLRLLPKLTYRAIQVYTAAATLMTSFLVWALLLRAPHDALSLLRVSDALSLTLRLDGAGTFFVGIVATLWPLTALYAFSYMQKLPNEQSFFGFFTMAYGATLGVGLSGNLLTLLLCNVLLTLTTAPMIRHTGSEQAKKASRLYLLLIGAGLLLATSAILYLTPYGAAGSFASGGLLHRSDTLTQVFFVLGFVGFGANAAIVPLHFWLPNAACAPSPVTALLNDVTVANVGVFAILRLTRCCFDPLLLQGSAAQYAVMSLAMLTMLTGAVMAVKEQHWKRRLAWSTMANISYILFAISLLTKEGATAGLVHMAFHANVKILAIFCAGAVLHRTGQELVSRLEGLGAKMPLTFGCFTLASLALIGIPPFSGFFSKWGILVAAAATGEWPAYLGAGMILLAALHAAVYMLTTVVRAWFPRKGVLCPEASEVGWRMAVPMAVLACGIVCCTVFAQPIMDTAARLLD